MNKPLGEMGLDEGGRVVVVVVVAVVENSEAEE
jgi:hypothetical protein